MYFDQPIFMEHLHSVYIGTALSLSLSLSLSLRVKIRLPRTWKHLPKQHNFYSIPFTSCKHSFREMIDAI